MNEDGYSDIIVSMPTYDNGQEDEGMVIVYRGTATGIDGSAIWYRESNQVGRHVWIFGLPPPAMWTAMAMLRSSSALPVTSDDLWTVAQCGCSTALLQGLSTTVGEYYQGVLESAYLGVSVAPAGDVNGDGYGDIIIGSSRAHDSFGQDEEGFRPGLLRLQLRLG